MSFFGYALAFGVAVFATFVDVNNTFYVPEKARRRVYRIILFYCFFHGAMGILAFHYWQNMDFMTEWPPSIRGLFLGASYLAVLRIKLTTIQLPNGGKFPFGFEFFYDATKDLVYQGINKIASRQLEEDIFSLVNQSSLSDLYKRAHVKVNSDALLTKDEKIELHGFFKRLLEEGGESGESEMEAKVSFAQYIITGKPTSPAFRG